MKVLLINLGLFGSTGKIIVGISKILEEYGHQSYMAYPDYPQNMQGGERDLRLKVGIGNKVNTLFEKITGYQGCFSLKNSRILINFIKQVEPDVINLHNLHGMKINLGKLFKFFKESNIPIVWTLHDCWSFTGQCPHFTLNKCEKWREGCHHCDRYKEYPSAFVDRTKEMWKLKKKWFTGVHNLTIVTPSTWLARLVKQSFLMEYPIKVIYNGIDRSIFKPTKSNFRMIHNLQDKKIILGVAFGWSNRKGLDVFIELSKRLADNYQLVLVGKIVEIDGVLPNNILSVSQTHNQGELAEIYSVADVFVNPTREEVLGMVNIEALACGTPVVTFNSGGSPECIDDSCGMIVECDNIDALEQEIIRICRDKPYSKEACIEKSIEFDNKERYKEYLGLYEGIRIKRTKRNCI